MCWRSCETFTCLFRDICTTSTIRWENADFILSVRIAYPNNATTLRNFHLKSEFEFFQPTPRSFQLIHFSWGQKYISERKSKIRCHVFPSLPRPQASLLIISWCAWRCGIGALQSVHALRVLHPSHDAPPSLFARATPGPGDAAVPILHKS